MVLILVKIYISCLVTKPTKWHVRPAKTQTSLGVRPVWSESSLSAWRKLQSLATHWAHSKDSDQTGQMPRLIWVFAGRTYHFVGFFREAAHMLRTNWWILTKLCISRLQFVDITVVMNNDLCQNLVSTEGPKTNSWILTKSIYSDIKWGGYWPFFINLQRVIWCLTFVKIVHTYRYWEFVKVWTCETRLNQGP